MSLLSENQKQRIRTEFYKSWRTCENEKPQDKQKCNWTIFSNPLVLVLPKILKDVGVLDEIDYEPRKHIKELLAELELTCATCGNQLSPFSEVGKYIEGDEFWHSFSLNDETVIIT